jgi:hypothetical protein
MTADRDDTRTTAEVEQELRDEWVGEDITYAEGSSHHEVAFGTVTQVHHLDIPVADIERSDGSTGQLKLSNIEKRE